MPQPDRISALPVADPETLDEDLRALFALCREKLGIVPNVLRAYSLRPQKLRNFVAMYNELMLAPSGLTKLEREMVAVVVSSANRCYYCLVAHGQAVRRPTHYDQPAGAMQLRQHRGTEAHRPGALYHHRITEGHLTALYGVESRGQPAPARHEHLDR